MPTRRPIALVLAAGFAFPAMLADIALGAELPLKSVTLYRSGVGSFEHAGPVTGDESVRLRFEASRVNDILKSMVLADLGGGRPVGVTYQPIEPLARRLADFRINPLNVAGVADLMRQIVGTEVELKTSGGTVTGVVLTVEQRPVVIGAGTAAEVTKDWAITLVTRSGVATVPQADVRSFQILDTGLSEELSRALAAVARHRDDRQTEVEVAFAGRGDRNVAISYTHEAPVWKTSYRLVIPEGTGARPSVQGWAIVENDTDEDWSGVRLSLASGRPVSFVMDLQTPLILARPNVPVPVIATLGPTVYEGGVSNIASQAPAPERGRAESAMLDEKALARFAQSAQGDHIVDGRGMALSSEFIASLQAAASAGDVGAQFIYTIDAPVDLARGSSAMLPILSNEIEGRRVTIYSALGADAAARPMLGVELTNTSGLHIMPGPIAVYDAGAYAGDAQIGHIARGDQRLLSYAIDHELEASRDQQHRQDVRSVRIVNGALLRTNISQQTTAYTYTNNSRHPRTVLVEHPKQPGWAIVGEAKPRESTDSAHRFEITIDPGATETLRVITERVWSQSFSTDAIGLEELIGYVRTGKASQAVLDAVTRAAEIQATINDLQSRLSMNNARVVEISRDQDRIRHNMAAVSPQSDLYARYMQRLTEQEDTLDELRRGRGDIEIRLERARAELREHLSGLNIN